METLMQWSIDLIVWMQQFPVFEIPMQIFTYMGSQEFYLLILPALFWSLDYTLGLRMAVMLVLSGGINDIFKLSFHQPRPYWVSTAVQAMSAEASFGLPSGHTIMSTGVWGMGAATVNRPWIWVVAIFLILMVGVSRIYLGVHFLHDVILGWLLGAVLLVIVLRLWDKLTAWVRPMSLAQQCSLSLAFALAILLPGVIAYNNLQAWPLPAEWISNAQTAGVDELPHPITLDNTIASSAVLLGLLLGAAWFTRQGKYESQGQPAQYVLRYAVGVVGILVLWMGLKLVFPEGDDPLAYAFRYLRYTLIGFWLSAGAPYLFARLGLARLQG